MAASMQMRLERQDLSCTYLAHHELESVTIFIIIIIIVISIIIIFLDILIIVVTIVVMIADAKISTHISCMTTLPCTITGTAVLFAAFV